MEKNKINVILKKENEKIVLEFDIEGNNVLYLEDDNSEEIKKIFLSLAKIIRKNPIELDFNKDDTIDETTDKLFIDSSQEYIKQLNTELSSIENNDYLKELRASNFK